MDWYLWALLLLFLIVFMMDECRRLNFVLYQGHILRLGFICSFTHLLRHEGSEQLFRLSKSICDFFLLLLLLFRVLLVWESEEFLIDFIFAKNFCLSGLSLIVFFICRGFRRIWCMTRVEVVLTEVVRD